jgi:hypothetical protein
MQKAEDGKPIASGWAQEVINSAAQDTRAQPWKAAMGATHDKGVEGQDLINLDLPNFLQCGGLAA